MSYTGKIENLQKDVVISREDLCAKKRLYQS